MDNYYTKYLKYKNKYIELKRANCGIGGGGGVIMGGSDGVIRGGYLGSKQCPETFGLFNLTTKSVWYYLRKYRCKYDELFKKIPRTVNAITYADFERSNNEHPEYQQITIKDLLNRGFPVEFLRERGFLEGIKKELKKELKVRDILYYLYDAEYIEDKSGSLEKIKNYEFTIADFEDSWHTPTTRPKILKRAGFSATELKKADYPADTLKRAGFTFKELQEAEFPLTELKSAGFNAEELKKEGFTADELEKAKILLDKLTKEVSLSELKKEGFTAK